MDISKEAYEFLNAKDDEKQRAESLRSESAARSVERLSRENYRISHANTILKGLLLISVIGNVYVALIGWGILK
jgi:hypothetical protein